MEKWKKSALVDGVLTKDQFWNAVNIWFSKPHLVNKRVAGVKLFELGKHGNNKYLKDVFKYLSELNLSNISDYFCYKTTISNALDCVKCQFHDNECSDSEKCVNTILLRIICPRRVEFQCDLLEIALFDSKNSQALFYKPILCEKKQDVIPDIPYGIVYSEKGMSLRVPEETADSLPSVIWLKNVLLPKLLKWANSEKHSNINSLNLVPLDEYCFHYHNLKEKYGKQLCKIWTEKTDPQKFVYEDIAIAAYLLLLWKGKNQQYVDLGCGNGLLVFILNNEGHSGIGIDVRPRKIWDMYPPSTVLKVCTIKPSDSSLFPEADWIIGNHSDELTPWIPVIAARSSYKCNFFLLPCCPFEFSGKRYMRSDASLSQYSDYMVYIKTVCEVCGFNVHIDRLKIPSTKRVCLVSKGRIYTESDMANIDVKIADFIKSRIPEMTNCHDQEKSNEKSEWIDSFVARPENQSVRNCTQLSKNLIDDIISSVAHTLLKSRKSREVGEEWDVGKPISLPELIKNIPTEYLLELKKEHGGLKTLLKNNRNIFVITNNMVQFRKPTECVNRPKNWKQRNCWFYSNHPDSCPLDDNKCPFLHKE